MTELQKQVQRAQTRINIQRFLSTLCSSLAICLGIAAIAVLVPKIRPLGVDSQSWATGWLAGACGVGLVMAAAWTWICRKSSEDAAIEIDRRFGLKERVASSLSLSTEEAESEVGRALVADATHRVSRIDVKDQFLVKPTRWSWLPVVTGAVALAFVFLPDATQPDGGSSEATAKPVAVTNQIKKSAEELKKKLTKKREDLEKKGLKDASKLVKKLEQGVNELSKNGAEDKQEAMVKMNDLAKAVKLRRDRLKGSGELQKQLNQLKDLKVKQGPADKLAKALKDGDFQAALEQVADLQSKLKDGNLSDKEQAQLAEQMNQMQKKLNQMAQAHEQAKQELEQQIQEKLAQGDKAAAQKLKKQMQRLQVQDQQMQQMQKMADKMQKMAQAMQQGKQQEAAQQMAAMAQELQQLQQEMDELEALDDALAQMQNAKDAMSCQACGGQGCEECQGMDGMGFGQMGMGDGNVPGMGMGNGQGQGDRPEEKTDTNAYDSRVRAKPQNGRMVVVGNVRGDNKPGDARLAIQEAMEAASSSDENPLTNLQMPRAQREQAQQYFDAVREAQ